MIVCPACAHENVDGTQFCEMCGEELAAATPDVGVTGDMVKCPECGHENPADNMICEACGTELKPANAALPPTPATPMPASASSVADPVLTPIPDPATSPTAGAGVDPAVSAPPVTAVTPAPDTAAPVVNPVATTPAPATGTQNLAPGNVKLVVEQGQTVGAQFVLGDPELLVGREDEEGDIYPDIDLSDQDAGYVHRRHATLRFENGALTVTHLGGANKTRVNNKPLADDTPTPLNLGDKIGFGKVVVRLLPV